MTVECSRWIACMVVSLGLITFLLVLGRPNFFPADNRAGPNQTYASHSSTGGASDSGSKFQTTMGKKRGRFDQRFDRWQTAFKVAGAEPELQWNPGATARKMKAFTEWAGQVPPDLRRLLLKHDGQAPDSTPVFWVNRLLSCEEIMKESDGLNDINNDIEIVGSTKMGPVPVAEAVWWHPDLMLFLSDDSGGGIAVDRKTGEVWDWDHDGGMFGMLAPDIGSFFERMAIAYEEKRFTVEDAGDPLLLPEINPSDTKDDSSGEE